MSEINLRSPGSVITGLEVDHDIDARRQVNRDDRWQTEFQIGLQRQIQLGMVNVNRSTSLPTCTGKPNSEDRKTRET